MKPKILVILGPTATGKSELAVKLAKKYNGEVISSDSRQVYKGLDIGTGKITKKEMRGVPHHLIDVLNPKKIYTVSDWQKEATLKIEDILSRGKLPIICGGTGFYIESITENIVFPGVLPNKKLREQLKNKTPEQLFSILLKLDKDRAKDIDKNNPVRLIRAIEIAKALGKVPKIASNKSKYSFLKIGLTLDDKGLREKIKTRLEKRLKKGMIKEAENLKKRGLSLKRMRGLGLEYKFLADYLDKKINRKELFDRIEMKNWQFSRRQMTWFKRDKKIKWFKPDETLDIEKAVSEFI